MKYLTILISLTFLQSADGQIIQPLKEVFIAERTIGHKAFIQADFNGDGELEFLADANNSDNIILGKISGNDIQIQKFFQFPNISNGVMDIRYEDSNGDNHMEIYILLDYIGMIRYDTSTFLPTDTLTIFNDFNSYQNMILLDIDQDQVKEWVVLDGSDGLIVINPSTLEVIWTNPLLTGNEFMIDNLDEDAELELVLIKHNMITILDMETLIVEKTISDIHNFKVELLDMDANGDMELVYTFDDILFIYDHTTQTILDQHDIDFPFSIDYFIPYNLDQDPALEFLLTSEKFSRIVELNTFPFKEETQYTIEGERDLGFYIGRSYVTGEPDILLFTLGDYQSEYAGLVRYDPETHIARLTNIRCEPNAQLLKVNSEGMNSRLVTRPGGAQEQVINVLSREDFSTVKQIRGEDVFIQPYLSLDASVFSFAEKGISDEVIVFSNGYHLCFYNLTTNQHKELNSLSYSQFIIDDLDFDGSMELIIINNNGIHVYRNQTGFDFVHDFSTLPISSGYTIRTAQLDQGQSKEILAFSNKNLFIFDGNTGAQIQYINNITNGNIIDVTTYADGKGQFYIGILDPTHVYNYDYTNHVQGISFRYSKSSFTKGFINCFSQLELDSLSHFFTVFSDTLKVFSTQAELLFKSEYQRQIFDDQTQILIDDHDRDYKPNIITSSQYQFSEYEYSGPGQFLQTFYMTDIFPGDSTNLDRISPFILQFSEAVPMSSILDNLTVQSSKYGNLNFTSEIIQDYQIKITPDPIPGGLDTITLTLRGGLQSNLGHYLDTNHDEVSLRDQENPIVSTYRTDPFLSHNRVDITPLQTLPEIIYTRTNRHHPFIIRSQPDSNLRVPIARVHYGIKLQGQFSQLLLNAVDSVFDEPEEHVLLPLNTFTLTPGDYTFYVVAEDFLSIRSDTFFFNVEVIEESGYYDKNEGGNNFRTFEIPNKKITSNFKKIKEFSHPVFNMISHVVGGNQNIYFTESPYDSTEGFLRSIYLPTFEINWEINLPMDFSASPVHLNNGILYTSNGFQGPTEPMIGMYDIETGQEILKKTYNSNAYNEHSPLTNDNYLILPDEENNGVYSLDRWTGNEKWFRKTGPSNPSLGAPAIFEDKVYSVYSSSIQAIGIESGHEIWTVDIDDQPTFGTASIIIDTLNSQVIWSGEEYLHAFDAESGNLNWRVPSHVNYEHPLLYNQEIFHFGNDSLRVYAAATGARTRQKKPTSYFDGQPVAANGKLFVPFFTTFEVWDANTLATLWNEEIGVSDISIIDQYLILATGNRLHIYESLDQCCNSTIEWVETLFIDFMGEAISRKYTYDTIPIYLNGKSYFEVLYSEMENGGNWQNSGRYIRQENNKIYEGDENGEKVLFDFNLKVNDTFVSSTGIEYTVTSVDSIILANGETRKRLEMHCEEWGSIYWIDGIGSNAGIALYDQTCVVDAGSALLCVYQNGELLYDNPAFNTCWLQIVATSELQQKGISFSPNPAKDKITVIDPDQHIKQIRIFDSTGHIRYLGNELFIQTSAFNPGYYTIIFELKDGSRISEKMIKI